MQITPVLKDRGHDFWVSCLAGVTVEELPDKLGSIRVEGELVGDVFTHVYCKSTDNIKRDADAIVTDFGLGLRKKRVMSHPVPGCVYVLINNRCETALSKRKALLPSNDKRLSAEE